MVPGTQMCGEEQLFTYTAFGNHTEKHKPSQVPTKPH